MAPLNPNAAPFKPSSSPPRFNYYIPNNHFSRTLIQPPLSYPPTRCVYICPFAPNSFSIQPPPLVELVQKEEVEKNKTRTELGFPKCSFWIKGTRVTRLRNQKRTGAANFEFKDEEGVKDVGVYKTSLMIKNIPNKLNKQMVMELLDNHCFSVNQSLTGGVDSAPKLSEFDFLYLPFDFRTGFNLGYAFVNFTTPVAAARFYREYHLKSWAHLGSSKVCEVTYARLQGIYVALLKDSWVWVNLSRTLKTRHFSAATATTFPFASPRAETVGTDGPQQRLTLGFTFQEFRIWFQPA